MATKDVWGFTSKEVYEIFKDYEEVVIHKMNRFVEMEVINEEVRHYIGKCRTLLQCALLHLLDFLDKTKLVCSTGLCSTVAKWNSSWVCTCLFQSCAKNVMGSIQSAMMCFQKFEKICKGLILACEVKIKDCTEHVAENHNMYTISLAVTFGIVTGSVVAAPIAAPMVAAAGATGVVFFGMNTVTHKKQAEDVKAAKSMFDGVHKVAEKLRHIGEVVKVKLNIVNSSCESLMESNCCSGDRQMNDIFRKLEDIKKHVDDLDTEKLQKDVNG